MDPTRFDRLSRALAAHGPRRGVLNLLAALPLAGGLGGLLGQEHADGQGSGAGVGGGGGRRKRRKTRHKRRSGDDNKHRKGKHKKQKPPTCTPTTCAVQGKNCGSIADGCGTTLDCGACTGTETCGGGGTVGACGCTPSCAGRCGRASDGCGGPCDRCANGQDCGNADDCASAYCLDGTCQSCTPLGDANCSGFGTSAISGEVLCHAI